jgi:hypothetical protein
MPAWLDQVNAYRALANNLLSVTENTDYSTADRSLAEYEAKNLSQLTHTLPSDNPNAVAAASCNLAGSTDPNYSDAQAIQSWMNGVFHGIGLIDPRLKTVGFGSYRTTEPTPFWKTVAAINIIQGLDWTITPQYPIMWPANGKSLSSPSLTSYFSWEAPDARSQCGYTGPAGQPIFLLLGQTITGTVTASLTRDSTSIPCCEMDGSNYNDNNYRSILDMRGAVVLLPRDPLAAGNYTATITVGTQPYTWSFGVAATAAIGGQGRTLPIIYGQLYYIQNGYNAWSGGYLDVSGDYAGRGDNLLGASTATSNQRDGLSGTWKILSAPPGKTGPVQAGDMIYLQNQYPYTPNANTPVNPNVLGGYLDVCGLAAPQFDPNRAPSGRLLAVSTASGNQRDGLSGTWKILSATGKTGPVLANDMIYLQNQYPFVSAIPGVVLPPNVLGGYLDVPGVAGVASGFSTTVSNQRDGLSGTWRFVTRT